MDDDDAAGPVAARSSDALRRRLDDVAGFVEPLAARWSVERGRPRTRTLRRLTQTVELMLRIDEELLLPALGTGDGPAAATGPARLVNGIDRLRDTIGRLMRGATGRRDGPVAELRRLHADHRAAVDAWIADTGDRRPDTDWQHLATAVDERLAVWLAVLRADAAGTAAPPADRPEVRPPLPAAVPGNARSSPAARGPAESPDASPGDGSPD